MSSMFILAWTSAAIMTAVIAAAKNHPPIKWLAIGAATGIFGLAYIAFAPRWVAPEPPRTAEPMRNLKGGYRFGAAD